ncbi:Ferric enterobactin transport ATP-binding protein FepC [Austwickia sp. TVS 96-490-7B]|uniref:ABC transporter ATP-binding protein n=1 Tax=Austwickia sp. TVS 96-490-7B TaxID=2830843 RepID=UPI001C589834|nr:ABC transporter ATP-binding protein [Austwickia sp. TVS 96-490-7B]MBW3084865.1 Ferric enterobactin transport ATP-binding protein FepC [Austwickia sp. TVS 96-490-7B]
MSTQAPVRIDLEGVCWNVPGRRIVHDVQAEIAAGEVVGLVGPNGSGKSSLLRCVVGVRHTSAGMVRYDGVDIRDIPRRELARQVAFVDQAGASPDDLTLADVVALGRIPHQDRWYGPRAQDEQIVADAMAQLGITQLADRPWRQVSGGERQRAQVARALAQQPRALVLDEPTNHLDIRHQLDLMRHLRGCGLTVVVSLHDLGLAARHCDRVLVMRDGRLHGAGAPSAVLSRELIDDVFEVDAVVGEGPRGEWAVTLYPREGASSVGATVSTDDDGEVELSLAP